MKQKNRPEAIEETAVPRPVALGMKSHIGWTAVVALAGPVASAEVVAKRRIQMATTFDVGAVYHKSQELSVAEAEALIRASEAMFERTAREALIDLAAELRAAGCEPVASAVASGNGRTLPPLASILKSHALVHAAEGDLYRRVLLRASEACRIPALPIPETEIEARAAAALDHPNICTVHEIGSTTDGQPFIAMALYDAETLAARQGYNLMHWNASGMTFWAVSDLNRADLRDFARLIR